MAYTLLDLIKSKNKKRNEKGRVEYQSLPEGVKEVFYTRFMLFVKDWFITFEGALDLNKLEEICKQKNYSLINAEEVKDEKVEEFKKRFKKTLKLIDKGAKETDSYRVSQEVLNLGLDIFKPDIAYCVYKGRKKIAHISWYAHDNTLYFSTSQKAGLELAENYRGSSLRQSLKWCGK